MSDQVDEEILLARRALPKAQELLAGEVQASSAQSIEVGWYDQNLDVEVPAFAVVHPAGDYADLVGEILKVSRRGKSVFVYVHRSADAGVDLALCRRAFLELGELWEDTITATVAIV